VNYLPGLALRIVLPISASRVARIAAHIVSLQAFLFFTMLGQAWASGMLGSTLLLSSSVGLSLFPVAWD
jgi:hypothetical protein